MSTLIRYLFVPEDQERIMEDQFR